MSVAEGDDFLKTSTLCFLNLLILSTVIIKYDLSKYIKFTVLPLLQESAVSALAALCNEYYINENGEADPALQGNDSCLH